MLEHPGANIDLNMSDSYGQTALMMACSNGQKDVVKLLLNHPKIDLNARTNDGSTAHIIACGNGQKDIAELLFDHPNRKRPIKRRKL